MATGAKFSPENRKRQAQTNRKIHLDFHTPHWAKRVGEKYDAQKLVDTWKKAHVNAVTVVFGLCACGNAYYESDAAPVHPGLMQDLLTPLLPAAASEGIQIYVHFAPGLNDRAVLERPDWAMQSKDGSRMDTNGGKEWGWVCYNSPWPEERFYPQLEEFVPRFPGVEGIFLDMVMYPDQGCYCSYCRAKAAGLGLDMNIQADVDRLVEITLNDFMRKARAIVKKHRPEAEFTCNCRWFVGGAGHEALDFIELEAPVSWNSYHFPVMARYLRTLNKPSGGMTTRFPKNWGYFGSLNNETQLKYECSMILSTLGSCCIGDQLHPSGEPDAGVYDLIETVYSYVKDREEWALHADSVPYIGLLADDQRNVAITNPDGYCYSPHQNPAAFYGAGLALMEGSRHYDILDQRADFSGYKLLWLAENKTFDAGRGEELRRFVEAGGKLLITGNGLWQNAGWKPLLEELAGVRYLGLSDFSGEYIRPRPEYADGIPQASYFVRERFPRWQPGAAASVTADAVRPYQDEDPSRRFGHFHSPAGETAEYPAAVVHSYGAGKVMAIGASLAEDYYRIGSRHVRRMLMNGIDALLEPAERIVEADTDSPAVDISLMSQEGRWILHLTQYAAKRHTGNTVVEEIPLRRNIGIRLRPPQKPRSLYLAPSGEPLEWSWQDGTAAATVPELHIHQMVVLEF